ncbi:hypothetical protein AtEden1_Chr1g0024551 [Arabidopsis thaliana]
MAEAGSFRSFTASDLVYSPLKSRSPSLLLETLSFRSRDADLVSPPFVDYESGKYLLRYDVFVVWVSFPFSLLLSPGVFNYSPALVSGRIVSLPAYVIIRL